MFADIVKTTTVDNKSFLKSEKDWIELEKKAKNLLPDFLSQVSVANKKVENFCVIEGKSNNAVESIQVEQKKALVEEETKSVKVTEKDEVKMKTTDVDPFNEDVFATPVKPAPLQPAEKKEVKAIENTIVLPKNAKAKSADESSDTFNEVAFKKLQDTIDSMLSGIPNLDLDTIMSKLNDATICMALDHRRDMDVDVLNEKVASLLAKKESIFPYVKQLIPASVAMKCVEDFIEAAGMECSNASSKEKRLATVKMRLAHFYERLAKVEMVKATVEATVKHLTEQYEGVSRVITLLQLKCQIGEIRRQEQPTPIITNSTPVVVSVPKVVTKPVEYEAQPSWTGDNPEVTSQDTVATIEEPPFDGPYKNATTPEPKFTVTPATKEKHKELETFTIPNKKNSIGAVSSKKVTEDTSLDW